MFTSYPFKVALTGIWREKWINFLCILTIATGLFLITLAVLFVHNIELATRKLPEKFSITVFLEEGLSSKQIQGIIRTIKSNSAVKKVKYISKEDALKELKTSLADAEYLLEGLDENPLPATIELGLRRSSVTGAAVENLLEELKSINGVSEVQYGRKLLSAIQTIKTNSEAIGFILISALSAGIVFVCYSTVKILFYRKKDEIETLKLLGATKGFIRAPFLIEGGVIGLIGGVISVAGMLSLYYPLYQRLTVSIPLLKAVSIPLGILPYPPIAGLVIGVVGALIAIGRIKF
jgi:cell division transport system permease protein